MVGIDFSRFQQDAPKRFQKDRKMVPKMESKWNQDLEKDSPELILDAMKASANKNAPKKSRRSLDTAWELGLGALNKGKT